MKTIIKLTLLVFAVSLTFQTKACDVCGCGVNGSFFGTLPSGNTHFLGIRYGISSFDAAVRYNSDLIEDESSHDTFHRFDLVGRFSLGDRFMVAATLPYQVNIAEGSHEQHQLSGIGDASVIVYFKPDLNKKLRLVSHSLFLGAGVELPTGQHKVESDGLLLNRNFQLGSGSFDLLFSGNYTFRKGRFGYNLDASHKLNTVANDQYKFGNQTAISLHVLHYLERDKFSIIPYFGGYYEHTALHERYQKEQLNTGGDAFLASVGVQIFVKSFVLHPQFQIPIYQQFKTDNQSSVSGGSRFSLGLYYNFSFGNKTLM